MIQVLSSGSRAPLCARASKAVSQENAAPACAGGVNVAAPIAIANALVSVRFMSGRLLAHAGAQFYTSPPKLRRGGAGFVGGRAFTRPPGPRRAAGRPAAAAAPARP